MVALYGSETWVLTETATRRLEGFHYLDACQMARRSRPGMNSGGRTWEYPETAEVLNEVGLRPIREYIERRRLAIVEYISSRPVHGMCTEIRTKRGAVRHAMWWEQTPRTALNVFGRLMEDSEVVETDEMGELDTELGGQQRTIVDDGSVG